MLNWLYWKSRFFGELRTLIVGMRVAEDRSWLCLVEVRKILCSVCEYTIRFFSFKISDVLTEVNVFVFCESNCVFEVTAYCKERFTRAVELDRQGCVTSGSPQDLWFTVDDARHGVIDGARDRAVVEKKRVGDVFEAIEGFLGCDADRFLRKIATCRD